MDTKEKIIKEYPKRFLLTSVTKGGVERFYIYTYTNGVWKFLESTPDLTSAHGKVMQLYLNAFSYLY